MGTLSYLFLSFLVGKVIFALPREDGVCFPTASPGFFCFLCGQSIVYERKFPHVAIQGLVCFLNQV